MTDPITDQLRINHFSGSGLSHSPYFRCFRSLSSCPEKWFLFCTILRERKQVFLIFVL